jgi:hypothetical protein
MYQKLRIAKKGHRLQELALSSDSGLEVGEIKEWNLSKSRSTMKSKLKSVYPDIESNFKRPSEEVNSQDGGVSQSRDDLSFQNDDLYGTQLEGNNFSHYDDNLSDC